jgi:NitT/TauT family transport system substrate-binding protein
MATRKHLFGTMLLALAAAVPVAATAAQPAPWAGPKTTVRLGVSGRPDQAFLELAIRRGYFEQQGIAIETVPANSGNDLVAPLALNQIQVASGSPNAALFNALNRGIDLRIVADFAHLEGPDDGLVSIVARSDLLDTGAIRTAADLRGKRISLGNGRGQYSYMLTNTILEQNHISWSELDVKNLNFENTIAAFSNRAIDAGFMIEPLIAAAERQNIARILVKGGAVEDDAHLSILLYSSEFAGQADLATRFMVAYLRGARDYRDAFIRKQAQDAAIAILVKYLPVKDPDVWKAAMPQHTSVNGRLNVADIKRQAAVYVKLGDVRGVVPDIDKFVDTRFAQAAVRLLGPE